jgi:hypothetical protein
MARSLLPTHHFSRNCAVLSGAVLRKLYTHIITLSKFATSHGLHGDHVTLFTAQILISIKTGLLNKLKDSPQAYRAARE